MTEFGFTPLKEEEKKQETEVATGTLKAWSFSSLQVFETCSYRSFLKSIKRVPENDDNPASERGTMIHQLAEDFVDGKIPELPKELEKMADSFEALRESYIEGNVQLEGEWAFTQDWEPTEWFGNNTWARIKADVLEFKDETSAIVIDHKTGKKFGNELKHNQQLQLYGIATFLMFPKLEYIEASLWYLDHGEKTLKSYTREESMMYLPRWTKRAEKMTTTEEFIPKPSKSNCRYCPYRKNGACEWGIE